MRTLIAGVCGLTLAAAIAVAAQNNPSQPKPMSPNDAYYHSSESLAEKGAELLAQAAKKNGFLIENLETYPNSYTQLTARTVSGGGEFHKMWQDNFVVISGEATEITGGHLVDGKEGPGGEIRGSRVEGGESRILRKGDVMHIAANTPHQMIIAPGASIVYYVVKVQDPSAQVIPVAK